MLLRLAAFLPLAAACIYRRNGAGAAFSYDGTTGPLGWARLAPANSACENGTHQSPIVIDTRATLKLSAPPNVTILDVPAGALLENLGTTLEVVVNGSLTLDGAQYVLQQFHFHTPGEHRIDEEYFPLEMHMVFKTASGAIAVIGVPFDLADGNSTQLLTAVFHDLDSASHAGSETHTQEFKFTEILNAIQSSPIYAYSGSLTTPPCTEGVSWLILGTPLPLDVKTYRAVKGVLKYNARYSQNAPGQINLAAYAGQGEATPLSEADNPNSASVLSYPSRVVGALAVLAALLT